MVTVDLTMFEQDGYELETEAARFPRFYWLDPLYRGEGIVGFGIKANEVHSEQARGQFAALKIEPVSVAFSSDASEWFAVAKPRIAVMRVRKEHGFKPRGVAKRVIVSTESAIAEAARKAYEARNPGVEVSYQSRYSVLGVLVGLEELGPVVLPTTGAYAIALTNAVSEWQRVWWGAARKMAHIESDGRVTLPPYGIVMPLCPGKQRGSSKNPGQSARITPPALDLPESLSPAAIEQYIGEHLWTPPEAVLVAQANFQEGLEWENAPTYVHPEIRALYEGATVSAAATQPRAQHPAPPFEGGTALAEEWE